MTGVGCKLPGKLIFLLEGEKVLCKKFYLCFDHMPLVDYIPNLTPSEFVFLKIETKMAPRGC